MNYGRAETLRARIAAEDLAVRRIHPVLITVLLSAMALATASANQRPPQVQRRTSNFCYCQCQMRDNKRECTKMCELPKYEGRWWAVSCHKRQPVAPPKSPESRPRPSKDDDDDEESARVKSPR